MILWEDRKQLHDIVHFVRSSSCSDFYRKKYRVLSDSFTGSVESLPFLTRTDLARTPATERLYVSLPEVAQIGFTSGTTGATPLIAFFSEIERYYFDPSFGLDVTCVLTIHPQMHKFSLTFSKICREGTHPIAPLFVDPQAYANAAVLAGKVGADVLCATPTQAVALASYCDLHADRRAFRLLVVLSELLTEHKMTQLREMYPNARIANVYASAELGNVLLYPCTHLLDTYSTSFHLSTQALIAAELIDGELVLTYGLNRAFPMIRYKTGDYFEIDTHQCPCGADTPALRFAGRRGVDLIRTHGFEIRGASVDEFFLQQPYDVTDKQIHFFQSQTQKDALDIRVEIVLPTRPDSPETVAQVIRSAFLETFTCTAGLTVKELMDKGVVSDVQVRIVDRVSMPGIKQKPLVQHLT